MESYFFVEIIYIKQQVHILEHSKLYFISFVWHTMPNAKLQIPSKLVILINDKFPIQYLFSKTLRSIGTCNIHTW
jgi:hypothetical protein